MDASFFWIPASLCSVHPKLGRHRNQKRRHSYNDYVCRRRGHGRRGDHAWRQTEKPAPTTSRFRATTPNSVRN